jgi:hypothetical protein
LQRRRRSGARALSFHPLPSCGRTLRCPLIDQKHRTGLTRAACRSTGTSFVAGKPAKLRE